MDAQNDDACPSQIVHSESMELQEQMMQDLFNGLEDCLDRSKKTRKSKKKEITSSEKQKPLLFDDMAHLSASLPQASIKDPSDGFLEVVKDEVMEEKDYSFNMQYLSDLPTTVPFEGHIQRSNYF